MFYVCFSSLLQVINMNYTVVTDCINYSTEAIKYMFYTIIQIYVLICHKNACTHTHTKLRLQTLY